MNLVTGEMAPMEKLRAPFPASETGQLPRGGTTLDYVGHGAVTARMLDVDPEWNWEPFALDEDGTPLIKTAVDDKGRARRLLWIWLTIGGVRRIGVGSCPANQDDAEKVLIGDAIRNAAMRFGVALDLWIKGSPDAPQEVEVHPLLSGLTIKTFLDKCAAAGLTPKDIDGLVLDATLFRTTNPNEVYVEELDALRKAFEAFVDEVVRSGGQKPDPKPGKSVPKRPLPQSEGIQDVRVESGAV